MTCIRDRPLSELPTIEDFDQILEDLHAESNDWDTASAHLRNAYKENGKTPPEIEIEKPTSIIEFTYDGKRESFDFADIKQKRTEWGIFREGLKELAPVVTGIASQTNIEFSLTEWNNYYLSQQKEVDEKAKIIGVDAKASLEKASGRLRSSFSSVNDCNATLEEYLASVYKDAVASYVFGQFIKAEGLTGDKLFNKVTAKDIADAARSKESAEALAARLKQEEEELDEVFEDIGDALFADKAIYQEQCFLLSQISKLVEFKKDGHLPRLAYTNQVVKLKKKSKDEEPSLPVNSNAPIMIDDQPFGFLNRLTQVKHSKALFDLPTDKLSSLVPSIKLYKIETDRKSGEDLGFVEIKFDTNPAQKSYVGEKSALDLFKSSDKRGIGVGLKDFNFTFHGSDPFAAKKAIQAKMTIFATSFGDLIRDRQGEYKAVSKKFVGKEPISTYKFADLALKTGKTPEDLRKNLSSIQKDNLDKLNFRLKAVLGWSNPHSSVLSGEEKSAVNDSFININLTPTTHEFNFDEMGGVTFTINYLAYIEDYFNNSNFNIFSTSQIEANRVGRKLFYEFIKNENCDTSALESIKENDAKLIQGEKANSLAKLMIQMSNQNKILYYNLSYNDISFFLKNGRIPSTTQNRLTPQVDNSVNTNKIRDSYKTALDIAGVSTKKSISSLQIALTSTSRESNKVCFFYISDLIDVIMQNIDESLKELTKNLKTGNKQVLNYYENAGRLGFRITGGAKESFDKFLKDKNDKSRIVSKEVEKLLRAKEQFRKLRIVLGPIEIKDPFNESKINFCTIGDIPISLNYFMEFLTEKMLSKDQAYYPLTNFIKDVTNDLIRNFLNSDSCFDFNTKQRIRLNSSVITAFARPDKGRRPREDDLTYFIRRNPTTIGIGKIFNMGFAMAYNVKPPLMISGPSRDPVNLMQPDREFNYYVFYAGRSYPVQQMTGNKEADSNNGIFHYLLGKDRGIVKNISLERTDMQGLKELRFEQEGFDGLTQLREVYNANIDCFLNPHTLPGTYIYVEPKGFSPEAGINYTQFGIGGYYMITRTEHSIGPGKADTKIIAKWVADSSGKENTEKPSVPNSESKPKKCFTEQRKEAVRKKRPKPSSTEEIKLRSGGTGFLYGSMGKA